MIQLHVEIGCLCAGELLLLKRYDAGDCDSLPWPKPTHGFQYPYWTPEKWHWHLRSALYDAREMGFIPLYDRYVLLPDGEEFAIDGPTSSEEEEVEFIEQQARTDREEEQLFIDQFGCRGRF